VKALTDDRRRRVASLCGQLALLADCGPPAAADVDTPLTRVLRHLAAARTELDRLILADVGDTLDMRVHHGAALLGDAMTLLGSAP